MNIYEIITKKIMDQLEAGTIPWRKSWATMGGAPRSWQTSRAYSGVNLLILEPGGEYATFKQIKAAGGNVKKGAAAKIVVFAKRYIKEEKQANGDVSKEARFTLRYYNVFQIGVDTEGLNPKRQVVEDRKADPIADAELLVNGYMAKPSVIHGGDRACYSPFFDRIKMPIMASFHNTEEYYSTLFHEMIHSTGHKDRLNRETLTKSAAFGSETYSKEELVAEFGAAYMTGIAGISLPVIANQAAYIKSWLKALKNDKMMAIRAAAAAQKAVSYIIGKTEDEAEEE